VIASRWTKSNTQ